MNAQVKIEKPVIELRNIKHCGFASQETHCYEAKLYVNGKYFADVENDGHGGADHVRPKAPFTYHDVKALNDLIAMTYPPIKFEDMSDMDEDLETVCGGLVNDWLAGVEAKRMLKKLCYRKPGSNSIYYIGTSKQYKENPAAVRAALLKRTPDAQILNDMPLNDVIQILRSAS